MKKINTLCVVDDDAIFQMITSRIIDSTDFVENVKLFSNGKEAIDFIHSVQDKPEDLPDVIFLDLFMPVMDGWGFLEEFVSLQPELGRKSTIYLITSSINPADVERAKSISEVTDYIIKPLTKEKFSSIVESLRS